jgi:hypothetical protein
MPERERERLVLSPAESAYPLPSDAQVMGVTPEMASDWLSTRRWPNQRSRSNSIVSKYMKDMKEGRWKLTRQGLIFDTAGYNIDGQHRLWAIANLTPEELTEAYGHPWVELWVYPDEPTDTFDSYDQNFRRIAAHLINEPNSIMLAAGARFLTSVSDLDPWSFPRFGRLTTSEVLQTKEDWPELSRYVSDVVSVKNRANIPGPVHLAVIAQASRTELGTPDKINDWFDVLRTGAVTNVNDPRLKLRDRFLRDHRQLSAAAFRPLVYSMIVKAWNAFAKGEEMPVLVWRQTERIPQVEGFTWDKSDNEENQS